MAWLTEDEMRRMGFAEFGEGMMLSDKASFYNCSKMRLGSHVRIDDFCILSAGSGGIDVGNHVHVAAYASLIGAGNISVADFCGISSRVSIYSSNDDYSGSVLTGPTVPSEFTNVKHAAVRLGRHVIVGAGSIILPGVNLAEGVAIGALSLIKKDCEAFGIYAGSPATKIGNRKRELLLLEKKLLAL